MDGSWSVLRSVLLCQNQNKPAPIAGIFHNEKVIGAGFNLLVQRGEEVEEEIEPLDWLNCAGEKANLAGEEVGIDQLT